MKGKMKQQLKELDQKQQDFVQRIGEARDLLAELMFTSDAFFTLQKRELIHNLSCGCDHEDRYTKEGIIFCNDCGASLGFVEEDAHEPQFNYDLEKMREDVESPTVLTLTGEHSRKEIRELLLSQTNNQKWTGWKVKVDFQAVNHTGLEYKAERWYFINQDASQVIKTLELPLP